MEPESLSTQESTFRLLKSLSLPNILPPSLPPADFLKAYSKLQNTRSGVVKALRMEHLKKVRIQAVEELRFVKAIRHLEDVATMPRFMREYVELLHMRPVSGFLEAGEIQYFVIALNGAASPMHIDVRKDKGSAACFFSYKSLKPGPKIYDLSFRCRGYKIHSRFSFFKEAKAYLSVLPDQDTVITLTVSFGRQSPLEVEEQLAAPRSSLIYSFQSSDSPTPIPTRNQLIFTLSQAPRKDSRPSHSLSQSVDFIEVNKRLSPKYRPERIREINENRMLRAKFIREELENSKKTRAVEQNERLERRAFAADEAQYISAVLKRKQRFEKQWLRLIAFTAYSNFIYTRFLGFKVAVLISLQKSISCQRFQRAYMRKFSPEFPISVRLTALAGHHLTLFLRLSAYHTYEQVHKRILYCILDTIDQGKVATACLRTVSRVVRIQRNWRQKRALDQYFFRYLFSLWDRVVAEEEERRGRKGEKAKRFIHIDESQKTEIVFKEMKKAKQKLRDYLSGPYRASAHLISFLPKASQLRVVLLKWLKSSRKKPAKSHPPAS